jgi:hypothetical protein
MTVRFFVSSRAWKRRLFERERNTPTMRKERHMIVREKK